MRRTLILSILLVLIVGSARAEVRTIGRLTANFPDFPNTEPQFGIGVALNDMNIFVGANGASPNAQRDGEVIVFDRSTLAETQRLTTSDPSNTQGLGRVMTVDGSTLAVTAPGDSEVADGAGAVYIFTQSGGLWTEQQKILPSGPQATAAGFGRSLSLDGDTLAISQWPPSAGPDLESVFIYERVGGVFTLVDRLVPADNQPMDLFGGSVALIGDTIVVGAGNGDTGQADTGAVYVSNRVGGTWGPLEKLPYPGVVRSGSFGIRVAYDGSTLVASDLFADTVFVYEFAGGAWEISQTITSPLGTTDAFFGSNVLVAGNRMLVTAGLDDPRVSLSGFGYVYALNSAGTWQFVDQIMNPNPTDFAQFGFAAAFNNGRVVIGAPFEASDGAAYVFDLVYFDGTITLDQDTVVVTDPDPNRDPTVSETITVLLQNTSSGDPAQTVTLTETSADSGIFSAPVDIAFTDGDTLLATYDDVVNTTAGPVLRTAEVTVAVNDETLAQDDDDDDGGSDDVPRATVTNVDGALLTVTPGRAFASRGETVSWQITFSNPTDNGLTDLLVETTFSLPVEAATSTLGAVFVEGERIQLNVGSLAPGASGVITVVVPISADYAENVVTASGTLRVGGGVLSRAGESILLAETLPQTGETPWWRLGLFVGVLLLLVAATASEALMRRT